MTSYVFPAHDIVGLPVAGTSDKFPVRRVYCVGRNYAAHVREMGGDPSREGPFFFLKPADALIPSGATIPYPSNTANLHYEIELVVAIGKAGKDIPEADALDSQLRDDVVARVVLRITVHGQAGCGDAGGIHHVR